ncbi:zinc finger A20 and AN1 domain-containing stress-associated protein 3-like [Impatiens glandulifera]|uniref:zinc finger A20 and AN1 domain-containing stress-associated protein 3-like n=1 Tax=Impatiens glandulifera TaxID=253017 RepID=UPI001FB08C97|nr:zinc finger A20 and AN1 domain-containing stress-associated protein 3-like [Impatiens glandulifera]
MTKTRSNIRGVDVDTVILMSTRASRMKNQDAIDVDIIWMLANPKEIPNLMHHPLRTLLMERNPPCRYENMFCGSHRYSDKHGCLFDYHGTAHDAIVKAIPVIKTEKLNKI